MCLKFGVQTRLGLALEESTGTLACLRISSSKSLTLYNLKVEIMAGATLAPLPEAAPLPSFVNWTPMPLRQSALHSSNQLTTRRSFLQTAASLGLTLPLNRELLALIEPNPLQNSATAMFT
jgi:hypothetical protein